MKLLIIVPAFNEAPIIASTLSRIKMKTRYIRNKEILVIDDGSNDNTYMEAKKKKVTLLRHVINRGLGGAIGTGLAYAKKHDFQIAVTIDADGQHNPGDIKPVIKPILDDRADIVIGSRFLGENQIPKDRRLLLKISNLITKIFFGQSTTDSQSGFRAFGPRAIQEINLKTERMEVSSEVFSEIKRLKLRFSEVPISVEYTDYSKSKGQSNSDAFGVGFKLLLRLFR